MKTKLIALALAAASLFATAAQAEELVFSQYRILQTGTNNEGENVLVVRTYNPPFAVVYLSREPTATMTKRVMGGSIPKCFPRPDLGGRFLLSSDDISRAMLSAPGYACGPEIQALKPPTAQQIADKKANSEMQHARNLATIAEREAREKAAMRRATDEYIAREHKAEKCAPYSANRGFTPELRAQLGC